MRLLQISPAGADGEEVLDLHPILTVVTGLSPAGRDLVREVAMGLPAGRVPACVGLAESHGIFLDLTTEILEMLELRQPVDVVISRSDLDAVAEAPEAQQGPGDDPETAVERIEPGTYPELDEARAEATDAREALSILREAAEVARADLEEATRRRRRAEAALAAAQSGGQSADDVLAGATAGRRQELTEELERVDAGIAELSGIDARPIEVLLEAIRNPEPVEYVPSERAAELADEFERLQGEVARLESALEGEGAAPGSAMARLEAARAAVAEAERAMRKPELSPEQVARLEAAHDEVIEAERKSTRSLVGRRSASRRLEEAREAEQEILDEVGYPTWSAYVMGASLWSVDPTAEQRLDQAKFELEAAEAAWAELTAAIESDPEHAQLLDRLERVYLEAVDLLGGEPENRDLATALRELRVPDREISTGELVDALAYQLELVGIRLGGKVVLDTVAAVADAFLAEAAGVTDRIAELRARRDELDGELVRLGPDESNTIVDLRSAGELDLAEREAEAAEARTAEGEAAELLDARMALVDAAIQMESVAAARCRRIAAEILGIDPDERGGGHGDAAGPWTASTEPAQRDHLKEAVEMYLLARLADARSVSYAGSVPVIVDDALSALPPATVTAVLEKLDRMAEAVQVIYLSDDPTITSWAQDAGFERAAVVAAPPSMA